MIYICKIELEGIEPKIWRRFQFHSEITFHQLHKILQIVMGWQDYHLYEFQVGNKAIMLPDPELQWEGRINLNARREQVSNHIANTQTAFTYLYDFGDDWKHQVTLEQIIPVTEDTPYPICLEGKRNCPQEDSGGVWGHQNVLEALLIPQHPERKEMVDWLKDGYDPEHFDMNEVNRLLKQQANVLVPKSIGVAKVEKKPIKLTKSNLNKYLKSMTPEEMVQLIKKCFDTSQEIKRLLAIKILGEEAIASLFYEYQKKVRNEFFPDRGHGKLRLHEARAAIKEFERIAKHDKYSLELKLFYVEMGVEFTNTYGDIDERFYNNIAAMYWEVISSVNNDNTGELFEEYEERISAVVENTSGIGWGFHDDLKDSHAQLKWI